MSAGRGNRRRLNATFIMGSFLPKRSPRAVQNARLLGALGWQGRLIVPRVGRLPAHKVLAEGAIEGMRLHRVLDVRGYHAHRLLRKIGCQSDLLPDDMLPWALGAASLAAVLPPPDLLVTIGHPLSSHLAGWLAKRTTRRKTPWLAYFSDLWMDMESLGYIQYSPAVRAWNERLESAVVGTADALVVTNPLTREILLRRYPRIAAKVHVISQSFDGGLFPSRSTEFISGSQRLVMRYLGDFYGPRSPRPVLEALIRLERKLGQTPCELELYGRLECHDRERCLALLSQLPYATLRGEISYQESLQAMVDAPVLLVIDAPAKESPFLPSKLIDYLGANRPIVGFTSPGTAANVIRQAGGLVADVADAGAVEQVMERVIALWREGRLAELSPRPEVRAAFECHAVARRFDDLAHCVVEDFHLARGGLSKSQPREPRT